MLSNCRRSLRKFKQFSVFFNNQHCRQLSNSKILAPPKKFNSSTKDVIEYFGQPLPSTHPHLLRADELIPGICVSELKTRRQTFMEEILNGSQQLPNRNKKHLVIIPSSTKKYMSDKIPYVFRQNSDFLYLTGCLEVDTVLVLWIDEGRTAKSAIFMRPKDKHSELWDGPRTGVTNALDLFGVDEAYSDSELDLSFQNKYRIWFDVKQSDQLNVNKMVGSLLTKSGQTEASSPTLFVHKLRVIKSSAEMKLMRKTCEIGAQAINKTIKETKLGDSEHHVFARVDYYSRMNNASYLAYPPVVASGRNATTIHYINNNQIIKPSELILLDAGCEYGGYTSDITRTWPINGEFSAPQRLLYDIIFTIQQELFDSLNSGTQTLNTLFDLMCAKLGRYLQEEGLITKSASGIELIKAAYNFCPHHVSHYLGMDVHDTPLISRGIPLVPGMVFTVEPGVYIAADRKDVPKEFRGIGVRIEDDVLLNSNNNVEILTQNCVKNRNELETLVSGK